MAKTPNEKEIDRIRDAAVFRALNTPHKPHKPLKKKPNRPMVKTKR